MDTFFFSDTLPLYPIQFQNLYDEWEIAGAVTSLKPIGIRLIEGTHNGYKEMIYDRYVPEILDQAFIQTASGASLDLIGAEYGLSRKIEFFNGFGTGAFGTGAFGHQGGDSSLASDDIFRDLILAFKASVDLGSVISELLKYIVLLGYTVSSYYKGHEKTKIRKLHSSMSSEDDNDDLCVKRLKDNAWSLTKGGRLMPKNKVNYIFYMFLDHEATEIEQKEIERDLYPLLKIYNFVYAR